MCSIFGIVDFENRFDIELIFPQSASERRSVYITDYALLLHSHDANNMVGSMTLAFREHLYTVVYSGRIYNADVLHPELAALGANFTCGGPAEIFIYSYIMFGKRCTEKLSGDFVCSIYDEQDESLFLMQCSENEKNFYYTICDTAFVFSTDYKEVEKYAIEVSIKRMEQKTGLFFDRSGINQKG